MQHSVEYARLLYENVLEWYRVADAKAEKVLAFDGLFLAFITGSTFVKASDLVEVTGRFGPETWAFLAAMCLNAAGSVISALVCLRSRLNAQEGVAAIPTAEHMWFFQSIAKLPEAKFREQLKDVDGAFELQALGSQIHQLTQNVNAKHVWVDRAYACAATAFLSFLAAGISYLIRVQQ